MPRFTAKYTDGSCSPPNSLVVKDTANGNAVVLSMPKADLHQAGGGGSGQLATLVGGAPSIELVEREFWTPDGTHTEAGFDLVYTLHASGGDKEVGRLVVSGMALGDPFEQLDTYKTCQFEEMSSGSLPSRVYPNGTYSPLVVYRSDTSDYNYCVAMGYDVIEYNHPLSIVYGAFSGQNPLVSFRAQTATGAWSTIPSGQTRVYRVMVRLNDRTDTPIGPGTDAPTEWLWTLRGYQQFFRNLHGKPNYRSMGGWDGRPVASFNTSGGSLSHRLWQNDGANPETGAGYTKFTTAVLNKRPLNIERVIVWANTGWHADNNFNYAFRFATSVFDSDLAGTAAPSTVGPAYRKLALTSMCWGFWWGRSTGIDTTTDWVHPDEHQLDIEDADDIARCFAEADLAVYGWGARVIGLDAYNMNEKPGDGIRWLRMLKARYPRVYFVTELALPDIFHTIVPTYIIEPDPGQIPTPFWLHQYLCPGNECFFQFTVDVPGPTEGQRAQDISERAYSPLTGFTTTADTTTRAVPRWEELGQSAIISYRDRSNQSTWRDRHFRTRAFVR